ncbi:MAG: hypothetical protein OXF93_03380 [Acidobacteria bacterium]|nr:hypothetical protein [Acidobacteriota bacterium]
MSVVSIVGAGTLGGALAQTIAARDRVRSIRLVDEAADVAAGKALDIRQSAPLDGFGTRITAHGDIAAAAGADVVLLAGPAAAPDTDWTDDAGLALLDRLGAGRSGAIILCAGASHRRLVERAAAELDLPARRVFGTAPEALRAAVTAVVALDIGCPASDVALTVAGVPPRHVVVPWGQATVAGQRLAELLPATRLAHAGARTPFLWPPGPYALAAAAARIVAALVGRTARIPSCFVVHDGDLGARGRAVAAPVQLDTEGIARVVEPPLTARERACLRNGLADAERTGENG